MEVESLFLARCPGRSWAGTILPGCWRRNGWCRRRLRSLVELISIADATPAGLVRTKPRCKLQAHDVAIEVAQHFGKIGYNFEHNLRYPKITHDIMVYAGFHDARPYIPDPPRAQSAPDQHDEENMDA